MVDILDLVYNYVLRYGKYPPNWNEDIYLKLREQEPAHKLNN